MDHLRDIVRERTGEMFRDIERLKEETNIGDQTELAIKDLDGSSRTVTATVKAKYPHVVYMQYTAKSGRPMNISVAWNKLLLMLEKKGADEDSNLSE